MRVQFNQEIRDKLLLDIGKNGKYLLDEELFQTLYVKENYSISQMSQLTGLSTTVLQFYKKKLGLATNTRKSKVADIITREVAIKDYVEGGLTISEMSKKYNIGHNSVRNKLKELGLFEPNKNYDPSSATKTYKEYLRTGAIKDNNHKNSKKESMVLRGMIKCPVCGREFYPAPYHQWKSSHGAKVCSYSCSLKSGAKYWGVNTDKYESKE